MKPFDTHTHIMSERFDEDREALLAELFGNELISGLIEIGTEPGDLEAVKNLAEQYEKVWFAPGVHPHSASEFTDETEAHILSLLKHEKAVALGEIGLDFHYDFSPRDIQREVFIRQLRIAKSLNKPVIIHSREAAAEMFETLKKENVTNGVLHCFSENAAHAEDILSLGLYIAFGGAITHKTRDELREAVKVVPLEKLLIETDCPYMTPVPFRSKRNRPDFTMLTAEKIAELKNISVEEVIKTTTRNAEKLFGINII
ncbi:MAG: TatD family hydrolase [Christensenellaceae bacterium]|nr:TatD family hydrolase [Christensenellaceae bacterium]